MHMAVFYRKENRKCNEGGDVRESKKPGSFLRIPGGLYLEG